MCALLQLYKNSKTKLLKLQICELLCRGCRKPVPGHQINKQAAGERAMIYAQQNCYDCNKEEMKKMYERWQEGVAKYYRETYKGVIISPWHHYELKSIEK